MKKVLQFKPGFTVFVLAFLLLVGVASCASTPTLPSSPLATQLPPNDPNPLSPVIIADAKLRAAGLSEPFITSLRNIYIDRKKDWQISASKIVELNVLGFLYHGDYFSHDSQFARKKITIYIRGHQESFRVAQKKFKVSPKSIASLLWVETKLGKTMGSYPLPWVYYALVLGSHPNLCRTALNALPQKIASAPHPPVITMEQAQAKVISRCESKSVWALEELKSIEAIWTKRTYNPFHLKASFAGAFGIPQFIPSSYLKYATSNFRRSPDLFLHSDAILSVANFLESNGWSEKSPESQLNALYSYNRSKDYGLVITQISKELNIP